MEVLTDEKIRAFLALDIGYDNDKGYAHSYGNGSGYGYSNGYGDGYGYGNGGSYGSSYGDGSGHGGGYDSGYGYGSGGSNGGNYGSGDGSGDGYGIKEINGYTVYNADDIETIITSIRGNIAQGFILEKNTKLVPCYIVKKNNKFAHGNTLHDAFMSLQEKLYDNSTEKDRIEAFKRKFPSYDTKYNNRDLFVYHHVLTGSCRMGRESFVSSNGLSLDGKTTVREFVELTKNAYGGDIVKKLPKAYGVAD